MAEQTIKETPSSGQNFQQLVLLVVEGLVLLFITLAFWYNNNPDTGLRERWFWTLWFAVPIFVLRLRLSGYLWTHTYLHDLLIIFIILSAFNYANAPFQRESYLAVMGRPLLGIWTLIYFIELTRITGNLKTVLILITGMGACLAILSLTATQWDYSKMGALTAVIDYLPDFNYRVAAEQLDGRTCSPLVSLIHESNCFNPGFIMEHSRMSFNVNEVAGALAWMTPFMAALAMTAPRRDEDAEEVLQTRFWQIIRGIVAILFALMLFALVLGQSRFALAGFTGSLILLIFAVIRNRLLHRIILGGVIVAALPIIAIVLSAIISTTNGNNAPGGLSSRDAGSLARRVQIWQGGVEMMMDNPATGVGMAMFRTAMLHSRYRTSDIPDPHAHNEWMNIGAEMGLAGLLIFIGIQINVGWMLWQGWHKGDRIIRTVALATGAGLLAHAIYGLGDTIALWDRFHFIFWWLTGLAGAQYVLLHNSMASTVDAAATLENVE